MAKLKPDLTGQRFSRLLVRGRARDRNNELVWRCDCICGGTTQVRATELNRGKTKSCGCFRVEHSTNSIKLLHERRRERTKQRQLETAEC